MKEKRASAVLTTRQETMTTTATTTTTVFSNSDCLLLWSTQSGRAKACARRVQRILQEQTTANVSLAASVDRVGWEGLVKDHRDKLWVWFVSTTGDGEHCDSIQATWRQL